MVAGPPTHSQRSEESGAPPSQSQRSSVVSVFEEDSGIYPHGKERRGEISETDLATASQGVECCVQLISFLWLAGTVCGLQLVFNLATRDINDACREDKKMCIGGHDTEIPPSLWSFPAGNLSGFFLTLGVALRNSGRAARGWLFMMSALPLIAVTVYAYAYNRGTWGVNKDHLLPHLAKTNFFATIAMMRTGFFYGIFFAAIWLLVSRLFVGCGHVACKMLCYIKNGIVECVCPGRNHKRSRRSSSVASADPLLPPTGEPLDRAGRLETDDFKIPPPARAHPMAILQDLPIYLLMPFSCIIPGKAGAIRFLRVNLQLQMMMVNRDKETKFLIRFRYVFYLVYACFPSMVWYAVYLSMKYPRENDDTHWPPAGAEVSLPVLLLMGSAILACTIEQLRDTSKDGIDLDADTIVEDGTASIMMGKRKSHHLKPVREDNHFIPEDHLTQRSYVKICCLKYIMPLGLRWKSDNSRALKLKRLRMLGVDSDPMKFPPWSKKIGRLSSMLEHDYVAVLKRSQGVQPADVGNLFMSSAGVRLPPEPGLDWFIHTVSEIFSKISVAFVYFMLFVIVMIPNFFRPPTGNNFTVWDFPNGRRGWFCYSVYILSLIYPGVGFRFLLDGIKVQRKYMWKHYMSVDALTSMLQGKRAYTRCVPEVRLDTPSDMLAWLELNELVQELYSLHPVRLLGDTATSYTMFLVISLAGWLFYYAVQSSTDELEAHTVLIVMLFCFITSTILELVRVMWAGFNTNLALSRRVKQLNSTQQAAFMMITHAKHNEMVITSKMEVGDEDYLLKTAGDEGKTKWQELKESAQLAKDSYEHMRELKVRIKFLGYITLDAKSVLSLVAFFATTMGKVLGSESVQISMTHIIGIITNPFHEASTTTVATTSTTTSSMSGQWFPNVTTVH